MDGIDNFAGNPFRSAVSRQQQCAIDQLVQSTVKVHHIDEMFLQLTRILVQRFGTWIAQVWADRTIDTNQRIAELRALATRDILLPQHVLENHQLVTMAERILHERRSLFYLPVDHAFSPHYVALLKRQGLYYCVGHFSQKRAVRLPEENGTVDRKVPAALAVAFLLFFQHLPPQRLLAAIGFTLEQAMEAAQNSGLLYKAQASAMISANLSRQDAFSQLAKLIPGRAENAHLMRFTNPLAASVDIQDKLARRLYAVVDGRRSVEELSALASLTWSEMYHALRILLALERVRLYKSDGQVVDCSPLFNDKEG
ncbi:MAG TPA: hypothetical protein VFB60_10695 [Ktedonobacteraceae bacterium]|nr:hypothetical protein [Ktedonobacteraceae bacterium]